MTDTIQWTGSASRTVEKAVAAGYDETALRAAVEMYATKEQSGWASHQNIYDAIRLVRNRKGNGHLPLFDYWGDLMVDSRTAVPPPPGGFVYTIFEWGKGRINPETHMWEEGMDERQPNGEMRWVAGKVPMKNKNGTPLSRDVIGRFLAKMKGESGRFTTDGRTIFSYGWSLAHWETNAKGKEVIVLGYRMWDFPHSNTTRDHMNEVFDHLVSRAANKSCYPEQKISDIAGRIAHAAINGYNMDAFRGNFSYNHLITPPWKKVFALARSIARKRTKDDRATAKNYLENLVTKEMYTAESIAAYRAWANQNVTNVIALIDAYEERTVNTEYGKKFGPVPNRFAKKPVLIKKDTVLTEEKAILGWWFSHSLTLGYGDGRTIGVGVTHEVNKQTIIACDYGLHASQRIDQAHGYVHGRYLCRVLQWGAIDRQSDKVASQFRRYLAIYDTSQFPGLGESIGPFVDMLHEAQRDDKLHLMEETMLRLMGTTKDQRTPVDVPVAAE